MDEIFDITEIGFDANNMPEEKSDAIEVGLEVVSIFGIKLPFPSVK